LKIGIAGIAGINGTNGVPKLNIEPPIKGFTTGAAAINGLAHGMQG